MGMALSVSVDPPGGDSSWMGSKSLSRLSGRRPGRRRRGLGVGKAVQPRARSDWTPRAPRPGRRRSATPTERYQRSSADRGRQTELACLFLYRGLIGHGAPRFPPCGRRRIAGWLQDSRGGGSVWRPISRRWAVFLSSPTALSWRPRLCRPISCAPSTGTNSKSRRESWFNASWTRGQVHPSRA